jgi:hypothetical protein
MASPLIRSSIPSVSIFTILLVVETSFAADVPMVDDVEAQPLVSQTTRLRQALDVLGAPLDRDAARSLDALASETDPARIVKGVQGALDPLCVAVFRILEDGRVDASAVPEKLTLDEHARRAFLVKVINQAELEGFFRVESPNAGDLPGASAADVSRRWLEVAAPSMRPLEPILSGLGVEYRVIEIESASAGDRVAELVFGFDRWARSKSVPDRNGSTLALWTFDETVEGFSAIHQSVVTAADGVLVVRSNGGDPYIGVDVAAGPGAYRLRFSARGDCSGSGQLFWSTRRQPVPGGDRARHWELRGGSKAFREYEIDFESRSDLVSLRIDPCSAAGVVEFDWIHLERRGAGDSSRARVEIACTTRPATPVTFSVEDEHGRPAIASFEIRDESGAVHPAAMKRLAPDFFFQPQIYRGSGEVLRLPKGTYTVNCSRGPESIPEQQSITVGDEPTTIRYKVRRWIDPAASGWFSGDHHIHAAGCRHYERPTEGVFPQDMARHIQGEDLKVGANLTWGPCFDFQKRFFTGKLDDASVYPYLLRYDVEVSGFGSHRTGHLCLLRLREQIYPGGESKDHWPTLGLETLRWAKRQGAICGPAHSGIGIQSGSIGRVDSGRDGPGGLPSYEIPRYDGIGANEYIVDITHEVPGPDDKLVPAIDFISTMDTDRRAELNMWYHTLNVGYRVRASGETDFPCISGDRVGMGRVYVEIDGALDYDRWCEGIQKGRSYVSDGTAHILGFRIEARGDPSRSVRVGHEASELRFPSAAAISARATVAVRAPGAGEIDVELVVGSYPVARQKVPSDGRAVEVAFDVDVPRSTWVALRVFPRAHTNPVFILVGERPIRVSRASAEWCLRGVDQCWKEKERFYDADEIDAARAAYEHARAEYRRIIEESETGT